MNKNWQKRQNFQRIALHTNMEIEEEAQAYLLLFCQNVFSDDFLLQLQWNHEVVEWRRNTLQSAQNVGFSTNIEADNGVLDFILRHEKGFFQRKATPKLWEMLENLKVKPFPQQKSGEGRDGEIMELSIGMADICSTFYWHNCKTEPDWKSLDEIADFLWNFNKSLTSEDKEILHFSILTETKKMR